MADAYAYGEDGQDSQEMEDQARQIGRCVSKLKGSSRNSQLRVLAGLLEQLPQDVGALGQPKAQGVLLDALCDKAILHSKQKDVRMYAAACFAQLLRIYAPETPYGDKQLEPVFELLLWSINQVQEYQAPTYEFAVSVLQTISQTKSYFIILDWGREELLLDWVRALLHCVNAGSSALAGPHALEVLVGIVGEEGTNEAVLELLLSHLVPPKSTENQLACQLAQAVLKACESVVKPALQKYLTTLILSPISSNSDLHQHCYTLIYQLYMTVPQVLLPVIPHLTSELHSDEGPKRLEAAKLLGRLLSLPGNRLVNEYRDVLDALLRRFSDTQVTVRLVMLEFTPALVAAAGSEDLQQQVLAAAAERLQDYEEKVRLAAVKAVCQASRHLLLGPASPAAPTAAGAATATALLSPVDALLGSPGSQELTDAAAADLDLATAAELGSPGPGTAAAPALRDLPFVQEALKAVCMRLRDTKVAVRKAAASHSLAVFRAVVAAGDAAQIRQCYWLAARVLLCCKTDKELREQLFELTKDGLMGPKTPPAQAAAAWVLLWQASGELEREALLLLLTVRTRLQVDTLQFLALRRKLSGRAAADAEEGSRLGMDQVCKQLAAQLPQPDRAADTLAQLVQVRDNHAFAMMQAALAPGASQEAYTKARADALARVGSRSPAAEAVSQLLLLGRPSAWLPTPIMAALLQLAAQQPDGEQADLVSGAYQLLTSVSKSAPLLAAGLLPELHQLMLSPDQELQQLATQMLTRCAAQMRKCGALLSASKDAATAKLVKQQLLPTLRRMARGQPPAQQQAGEGAGAAASPGSFGFSSQEGLVQVAPKAAKWAVFGLAACQDSSSTKQELQQVADELVSSLDTGASDTAAKLQALATVGRVMPDALARHMETLLRFVTDDFFNAYLDAAAGAADMQGASSGGRRRSLGGSSMLLSPTSQATGSLPDGSQAGGTAELVLKCGALKALAAACVPDNDEQDPPVETLRVVARLSEFLEGLMEPGEDNLPGWMSGASPEMCGQLRLSAAVSLLRLARRHDTRISPATYCSLALMMQDEVEAVRAVFAAKVYRLMRFFLSRPSSHQLSAKYAAMLPLAAPDPIHDNKVKAARMLRTWVRDRRSAVQAQMGAAARGAQEGGSTLQDLPEMTVPYGLYILAHHPDFPQEADEPDSYTPFQFMLQFMLQPLLVATGTTPAGHTAPILLKMCRTLKRTADAGEPAATTQVYSLCDMAVSTVQGLAGAMRLDLAELPQYDGGIILPRGLYRALDKADRAGDLSYLPPGYEFIPDPQAAAPLAQPMAAAPAAGGRGRSKPAGQAGGAGGGGGRGSKRKAAAGAADRTAQQAAGQEEEGGGDAGPKAKRARGAAGGKARSKGRGKAAAAAAADSDDEGWDSEDAPPSAQKGDQLTRRQQVLKQQQQLRQRATAPLEGPPAAAAGEGSQGSAGEAADEADGDSQQQQQRRRKQQRQPAKQQRQMKQQQLTFAAAAAADASSPAPVRRGRRQVEVQEQHPEAAMNGTHGAGSSGGAAAEHEGGPEGSSGESPFALPARAARQREAEEEGEVEEVPSASKKARGQGKQRQGKQRQAAAAADGVDADGDTAMDEDQEQQGQQARRGAAARGGAGTKRREQRPRVRLLRVLGAGQPARGALLELLRGPGF